MEFDFQFEDFNEQNFSEEGNGKNLILKISLKFKTLNKTLNLNKFF